MAVACTHSYSFVSIETLSPGQACILELHKPLPVIRNTHRHGYSYLTGFLFLGITLNNCRQFKNNALLCYTYFTYLLTYCLTVHFYDFEDSE